MMGINGKVGVKGRTADVDVSFSDIFKNLDFAAEVHIEAWRDRFGFVVMIGDSSNTFRHFLGAILDCPHCHLRLVPLRKPRGF